MFARIRTHWRRLIRRCLDCGRRRDRPPPGVLCQACFDTIVMMACQLQAKSKGGLL